MNILNVNMSIDPVTGGGTAERTVQMTKHLSKVGVRASILTTDLGLNPDALNTLSEIEVRVLPCLMSRFYIPRFNYYALRKLVANADIVHLMNHWTLLNAIIYKLCRQLGKPYVVCPAGALPIYGRSRYLKKLYNTLVGYKIVQNAAKYVAIPAEEAEQYRNYGIDPQIVDIIPNGIDPDDFSSQDDDQFRKKYNLGDKPYILFMGRLNSIKGPDLLLEAFSGITKKFPHYQLVFAGPDGGMLSELKAFTFNNKLSGKIHFIGYIGGGEKSWAYHAADLLVIPSRQEAMSIVAIEAGITGTPVLMTDVCGFNQVSEIGGGLIVKPTVNDIQRGLMVVEDRGRLETMGRSLQCYVRKHYTWESVINKYIVLFEDIMGSA